MADSTVNGVALMQARIQRPRVGNWVAELVGDAAVVAAVSVGAQATINAAGSTFVGTVLRSDVYAQGVSLRVVGGTGGLQNLTKPRFYSGVNAQQPVQDALSDANSSLSSASSSSSLGTALTFWTMVQQAASSALTLLANAAGNGCVWRVQPDGSVFFGADQFITSALVEYDLINYMPLEGVQIIAAEVADVNPGETFNGRHVSAVEHFVDAERLRTRLFFET